ncbi:MAG TPA: hypothetical protein DCW88_19050 [Agrobacterium sp.]|uniref:Lar family restriction alleviation protein n=1 Tax=Agrobacterium pusense TaxID=648995 RepID=UPI000E844AED|nr:hypothetical protein [Agrobacterium sp.]
MTALEEIKKAEHERIAPKYAPEQPSPAQEANTMQSEELKPCPMCGADEASTYIGAPGLGVVTCFAVGCGHTIKGFASDADAIAEWNKRSDAMYAAMTEAYCSEGTEDDTLKECFLHHIRTTIGFLAFGMRTGPEMTMYEEGFKAGYRRCQSDNEPELGEDEDSFNERTRNVVAKLRESLSKGEVDPLAIDNAVDLLIDQSKAISALSAQVQDVAGLESNPVTLRWWCQQLLDIIENHDITHDSCDEEIAMLNDIRASVDPAAPAKQEG